MVDNIGSETPRPWALITPQYTHQAWRKTPTTPARYFAGWPAILDKHYGGPWGWVRSTKISSQYTRRRSRPAMHFKPFLPARTRVPLCSWSIACTLSRCSGRFQYDGVAGGPLCIKPLVFRHRRLFLRSAPPLHGVPLGNGLETQPLEDASVLGTRLACQARRSRNVNIELRMHLQAMPSARQTPHSLRSLRRSQSVCCIDCSVPFRGREIESTSCLTDSLHISNRLDPSLWLGFNVVLHSLISISSSIQLGGLLGLCLSLCLIVNEELMAASYGGYGAATPVQGPSEQGVAGDRSKKAPQARQLLSCTKCRERKVKVRFQTSGIQSIL